ncbi:hypothetical protein [Fimbriimonas ginsengisoli]|nr:hypothetical protein [Fimbriimonas ginsengisoli]
MPFFAQLDPKTIWNAPNGSSQLWMMIILALLAMVALTFGLMRAPTQLRRPIVAGVTFISGLFYVLYWLYPQPIARSVPDDKPRNFSEAVGFWIADAQPVVANISNIVAGFLIGLGIYSLLRIHLRKLFKQQKDWFFSLVLVVSLVSMTLFGYWDWVNRQGPAGGAIPYIPGPGWGFQQYARDLLFDGLLQQMDAAMFSIVAFYIMSAGYRAFRARSIEATILLITALVVLLSFMGVIQFAWDGMIKNQAHQNPDAFIQNFRLTEVYGWIRKTIQTPAILGIDFGVGIGLMAMGLRIWLSLERTGGTD